MHAFEGKVAVITGGGGGIGRATGCLLARRGAKVVLADVARSVSNEAFFGGAHPEAYFEWNERVIRGRAEAQLLDGTPDPYLW
ncbi:MAG: hypothetical protein M0Z30_05795 [Actinomycetota bacterium]|nr:hypothetical protein [Actinomycetota bacterium]